MLIRLFKTEEALLKVFAGCYPVFLSVAMFAFSICRVFFFALMLVVTLICFGDVALRNFFSAFELLA